jgi:hypothetical protein
VLGRLLATVANLFQPRWAHRFPQVARIERETYLIGRQFGLPEFKINWVSKGDTETEIEIAVLGFLFGYKRKLTFKYDTFILTKPRALRFYLWKEYLDISFRFLMRTKAQWVEADGAGASLFVKIFPLRLDNYIYLFLRSTNEDYELEIGNQEEGDGGIAGRHIHDPVRVLYNTWRDAIETFVQLVCELSMSEPEEALARVRKMSAAQQI